VIYFQFYFPLPWFLLSIFCDLILFPFSLYKFSM
jgi:hypothetical protein